MLKHITLVLLKSFQSQQTINVNFSCRCWTKELRDSLPQIFSHFMFNLWRSKHSWSFFFVQKLLHCTQVYFCYCECRKCTLCLFHDDGWIFEQNGRSGALTFWFFLIFFRLSVSPIDATLTNIRHRGKQLASFSLKVTKSPEAHISTCSICIKTRYDMFICFVLETEKADLLPRFVFFVLS